MEPAPFHLEQSLLLGLVRSCFLAPTFGQRLSRSACLHQRKQVLIHSASNLPRGDEHGLLKAQRLGRGSEDIRLVLMTFGATEVGPLCRLLPGRTPRAAVRDRGSWA